MLADMIVANLQKGILNCFCCVGELVYKEKEKENCCSFKRFVYLLKELLKVPLTNVWSWLDCPIEVPLPHSLVSLSSGE